MLSVEYLNFITVPTDLFLSKTFFFSSSDLMLKLKLLKFYYVKLILHVTVVLTIASD